MQLTNTFVFFFAGAACTNFFVRATEDLEQEGFGEMLAATIWRLPLIYITMLCVRALLIAVFSPMLNAFGAGLDWRVRRCSICGMHAVLLHSPRSEHAPVCRSRPDTWISAHDL